MKIKILVFFVTVFILIPVSVCGYFALTAADMESLPPLRDGDLVFETTSTNQTWAIWLATGSFYTHMGIIRMGANNTPYVIEAAGPVRETPLRDWMARGRMWRLTIMRVRGLKPEYARRVLKAAMAYYGKPYDPFFLFDKDKIYCSELVYYAFKEGIGVDLGVIQTFEQLQMDNTAVQILIYSRWKRYPPCLEKGIDLLDECLQFMYSQQVITPISIAQDPRLETVYSNY
ncbi:MAG: peptidoglycan peptidase [Rhodospirillales bacterium]|nr:peptidoglycan peptidase [Alphaproteobacteria bacterium]MCB1840529.1 peptidoglycan peptidase [Alphaproteobacteria bacterium]MCB9977133.1 peptidoglycan peptidase [Rhodospirillales bacterium]